MNKVSFETLKQELPELMQWLGTFRNIETKIIVYRDSFNKGKFRLKLSTENYLYTIDIISPSTSVDGYHSYMSCAVNNKNNKYEIGKELSDGEYSESTFNLILKDILGKELLPVV